MVRVRLRPPSADDAFGTAFDQVIEAREHDADEFYDEVIPESASEDEKLVARQAFAGMIWASSSTTTT